MCQKCGSESFTSMWEYSSHLRDCEGIRSTEERVLERERAIEARERETLPLAVLHQKARDRCAELEEELRHVDAKRQELVRLRNWVAWLEQTPGKDTCAHCGERPATTGPDSYRVCAGCDARLKGPRP